MAALRRTTLPGTSITLEQKPIDDITTADVKAIRNVWPRTAHTAKAGRVGADRALKRLRHVFNWAIQNDHVDHTPFNRHGTALIHFKTERGRTRRLEPGEEDRLLQHAPPFLKALITAALETGLRRAELLGLRWRDVKIDVGADRRAFLVPAEITKTNEPRDVPITAHLMVMLERLKYAPDGTEHPPHAFVFGDECGGPRGDIRAAWTQTRAAARITNLHFHDLRREFGSRLRETPGVTDTDVRDWLGHANLTMTNQYLATTRVRLQDVRRAFEQSRPGFTHHSHTPHSETLPDPSRVGPESTLTH